VGQEDWQVVVSLFIGETENGVMSVSSLLAGERVYYPVEAEPYIPAHHFEGGKNNSEFRTTS
jgi:hypothetical protein